MLRKTLVVAAALAAAMTIPASAGASPADTGPLDASPLNVTSPFNLKDSLDATHQMVDICCRDFAGDQISATSSEPEGEYDTPNVGAGFVHPGLPGAPAWPWTGAAVQFDTLYNGKRVFYIREKTLDPAHNIVGCWNTGPDHGDSHIYEFSSCSSSGDTWFVADGLWVVSVAWTQFHHDYPYGDAAEVDQGSGNYLYNQPTRIHPAAFNNQIGSCNCG